MSTDTQGRKWIITINNPEDHNLPEEKLIETIRQLPFSYSCLCYEKGSEGTRHVHIYIYSPAPIRFSRIKNLLPCAHIDRARGKHQEIRDYISKSGKWEGTEKEETNISESFQEFGTLPEDRPEKEDLKLKLLEMIKCGMTNAEIIEEEPRLIYQIRKIDEIRQTLVEAEYATKDREIVVVYVTGPSGAGKTRAIHEEFGAQNICRITSYRNGTVHFDNYRGQDVLVFEEFSGQIPITEMLNYLDRYPLKLPARYMDRQACYTKVFITSNLELSELYKHEQQKHPETWKAFLRRISKIKKYTKNGDVIESSPSERNKSV